MGSKILLAILLVAFQFSTANGDCNPEDFKTAMASDTKNQDMKAICSIPKDKRDNLPNCLKERFSKYSVKEIKDEATNILEVINKINSFNTLDSLGDKLHKETPELSQVFECSKDETIKFANKKTDEIMNKIQLPQTKEFVAKVKQAVKDTAVQVSDKIKSMWKDLPADVKQNMVDALSYSFETMEKIFSNTKVQQMLDTKSPPS